MEKKAKEKYERFIEARSKIDMLGFKVDYITVINDFGVATFQKQDEDYTYVINVNVKGTIALYKVKKLKANNMVELAKEVNQEHKAEVWLAPKEVVELSLKLYDLVELLYKE